MIAINTHILAWFYCTDPDDKEAQRQSPIARQVTVQDAVELHRQGCDFADALHRACSKSCEKFLTFDDKKFARRAANLALSPKVQRPGKE